MSDDELRALALAAIETFDNADWDGLRRLMSPSYVYEETGTGRRIEGPDAVIEVLKGWRAAIPDLVGRVERIVVQGDTAVMEIAWSGTQTGPLDGGQGPIPPTGRSYRVWATMWVQQADRHITACRHHLDLFGMFAQLGLLPAPASA